MDPIVKKEQEDLIRAATESRTDKMMSKLSQSLAPMVNEKLKILTE